ncbi:DUF2269 family protein [Cohnella sp. JJ-181]|uniref:DUF2269 family protein n=1 Tax=Cohnella rhizoplanae TaxID=2974897 RepID=UPI0022FF684B|nr:DUF2269 family protein [Cohnella sp. JJ-181]CAI6015523.1 hypothetical protein COHCIP112018_00089 [Cohnella sp. JJ-181]
MLSLTGYAYLEENWLRILVAIHVVSAVVGIGPTYFGHVLLRKGQTLGQLRDSLSLSARLELFPKILGSLAVVSGLLLVWLGDYGWDQLWIVASIADYVLIQVVVIAFMARAAAAVAAKAHADAGPEDRPASEALQAGVARVNAINYVTTALGIVLFLLMFFKPTL